MLAFKNVGLILFAAYVGLTLSCSYSQRVEPKIVYEGVVDEGVIIVKSKLYDRLGNIQFEMPRKIWYKDSLVVEEITKITIEKPAGKDTIIRTITPLWYRFIDLQSKTFYDYKSFSDTAIIMNKGPLPDSTFSDQGWAFFSDKGFQYLGNPENLGDTVINGMNHKRVKFPYTVNSPEKSFRIGFYRCDNKGAIFSLEKKYSKKIRCTMTNFTEYLPGYAKGIISQGFEFVTDTLAGNENRVIEKWKENERKP